MAFSFAYRLIGPADPQYRTFTVGVGKQVKYGDLVKLSSGAIEAAATGDTVVGVVVNAAPYTYPGANPQTLTQAKVIIPLDCVFEVDYIGTSKKTLTDSDIGESFDLATGEAGVIDLDSKSNGDVRIIDFDNTRKKAFVTINNQLLTFYTIPDGE